MGGAIKRVGAAATVFPHRDASWLLNVPASWTDAADSEREVAWVRETYAATAPFASGGAYSNSMEADDWDDSSGTAYGATLCRLPGVEAQWDPDNVFRLNQNVLPVPATDERVREEEVS